MGTKYVRTTLNGYWAIAPIGTESGTQRVAWLTGLAHINGSSIFVALCGSIENFENLHVPAAPNEWLGWYPSSAEGLQQMVEHFSSEGSSERMFAALRPHEALSTAYTISHGLHPNYRVGSGQFETLLEVFDAVDDLQIRPRLSGHSDLDFRRAILGTPLWASCVKRWRGTEPLRLPRRGLQLPGAIPLASDGHDERIQIEAPLEWADPTSEEWNDSLREMR